MRRASALALIVALAFPLLCAAGDVQPEWISDTMDTGSTSQCTLFPIKSGAIVVRPARTVCRTK